MITLTSDSVAQQLYDGLQWSDEFTYSPVAMTAEYSTDGSLMIDQAVRKAGRPITLVMPSAAAWATTRAQVEVLQAWASRTGEVLTLNLRGRSFSVMFNHAAGIAFEATLMRDLFDDSVDADAEYRTTYRFIEV